MKEQLVNLRVTPREIMRRRRLREQYFEVGRLYKTNKKYSAVVKEFEWNEGVGHRRGHMAIPNGSILLCTKNEMIKDSPFAIIEFLLNETVLHYISDAFELCQVMDPMLPQKKVKEDSHE